MMMRVTTAVIVMMLVVFGQVQAELVVHYAFDDGKGSSAFDSAGSNENGTLVNMEKENWVAGKIDSGALSFDGISATGRGTDEYISAGPVESLNLGQGSFTISAWIKDTSRRKKWKRGIVTKSGAGTNRPGFAFTNYGLRVRAKGKDKTDLEFTNLQMGQWVHVVAVRDAKANELRLYVNGGLDNLTDYPGNLSLVNNKANLIVGGIHKPTRGKGTMATHGYFEGLIDDVRIYKKALTPAEIEALIPETVAEKSGVLLFCGFSSERFGLQQNLTPIFGKERLSTHNVLLASAAVFPRNVFCLDSSPSPRKLRQASRIILIDMPLGPPVKMLPQYLLKGMQEAVRDKGAQMVVFGGMFAFGKGQYVGSVLEEMLPVKILGKWDVKKFSTPQVLELTSEVATSTQDKKRPSVLWYHEVELKDDDGIKVLATADSKPILVRWKYGKGTVSVFLGAAYDSVKNFKSAGATPFWTWKGWGALSQKIVQGNP